ncbi:1-phosphatidylinositol 3-phosphate 5-kinase [Tripterygium wilfordii]|uniref:1-phosphatidylinositol 3-phosphate 5-kinase n=1 Tax=Tripterygium wilfordii TaxID=458696 RepID=A0A7J7CW79_TRIWF|nr:bromodomain and WD repeat-containing protein 1-like [Tripterygium wilfordii]KAF5738357.1 1-phosphatidylinositol 3-phosphate 5-kinase [Tripterygium wilfordii]
MENQNENQTWNTWEELLLACAVKRHGYMDWDSVSMEIQTRSSLPNILTTANHCKLKYHDLKRRFTTPPAKSDDELVAEGEKVDDVPWLEELRKLRVAELKQEVQRYDVSILSLQSKVKRLEEEREREQGFREENGNIREKPDLEEERSENDKRDDDKGGEREEMPVRVENRKLIPGEDSDRENRSVNGSNSTCSNRKAIQKEMVKSEPDPVRTSHVEPQPVMSGSNSKPEGEDDSVTQFSSDVQSSASLGSKRKRKVRKRRSVSGDSVKPVPVKSEPLIQVLDLIRSSQHGSLFERRLESQETEDYKNLIKQHMDLGIIQERLDQGSYKSCSLSFYRDLLLLFHNAIVFFPKSSQEWLVACELLTLVSAEIKKETQKSDSTQKTASVPTQPKHELEKSDSLLARQKSSAPIVVCRKRSSISSKSSLSSSFAKKVDPLESRDDNEDDDNKKPAPKTKPIVLEQQSLLDIKPDSKPKTGTRSTRRGSKLLSASSATPNKKQSTILTGSKAASNDKVETVKSDKKKAEALALEKKKGAADFLKRIKKNYPQETSKKSSSKGGNKKSSGGEQKNNSGKKDKGKDRMSSDRKQTKDEGSLSKRSVGRPPKKTVEASTVTGRRRRESDGNGVKEMKRPTKRSRR